MKPSENTDMSPQIDEKQWLDSLQLLDVVVGKILVLLDDSPEIASNPSHAAAISQTLFQVARILSLLAKNGESLVDCLKRRSADPALAAGVMGRLGRIGGALTKIGASLQGDRESHSVPDPLSRPLIN